MNSGFYGKTFVFCLFFTIFIITFIQTHEEIHMRIAEHFNITSAKYVYQLGFLPVAVSSNREEYFEKCSAACKEMNEWNEIIGYYTGMVVIVAFVIAYLFFVKDDIIWKNARASEGKEGTR